MKNRAKLIVISTLAVLIIAGCAKKSSSSGNSTPDSQPASANQPVASTNPEPQPTPAPETTPPAETTPPSTQPTSTEPSATHHAAANPETAKTMPSSDAAVAPTPAPPPEPEPIVIPAGTGLVVRLDQKISTKTAAAGSPFTATVAKPLAVGGETVIPKGARAEGVVATSKSPGKFKGEGLLTVKLTKLTVEDSTYPVDAKPFTVGVSGKGKRSSMMIGGGAAAGALIGGLAGGGKGAAIGALSGGGAGTAGAALTGNTELDMPVETAVRFELVQPITLKGHPGGAAPNTGTDSANQGQQSHGSDPTLTPR